MVPESLLGMIVSHLLFQAELGFSMYLLDIGGGFPGSEDVKLKYEEVWVTS